jgi:methyltransferase (TIGR00027 family)
MERTKGSQTAVLVCMGRALAHGRTDVGRFSDPTAFTLLPDDARTSVTRLRAGAAPKGVRQHLQREYLDRNSKMMVARTIAIDEAVRDAGSPQVVILGAGLDGRAWRMPELRDVTVFEVDHPASQQDKRARVDPLTRTAREVRFVPVDFTRDRLDDALAAAGHDPSLPTTWIWEGVVMYLTPADIERTLAAIARRSAKRSRVIVAYHRPALMLWFVGWVVRRVGEPLRSAFTPEAMRALLGKHGFAIVRDQDIPTIGAAVSPEIARATRPIKHSRIATADRVPTERAP